MFQMMPCKVSVHYGNAYEEGYMYAILPDSDGVPCGTCYLPAKDIWVTVLLADITPDIKTIKQQINE